jgi:hypothetical protein
MQFSAMSVFLFYQIAFWNFIYSPNGEHDQQ